MPHIPIIDFRLKIIDLLPLPKALAFLLLMPVPHTIHIKNLFVRLIDQILILGRQKKVRLLIKIADLRLNLEIFHVLIEHRLELAAHELTVLIERF